jgi:hypothetical protein
LAACDTDRIRHTDIIVKLLRLLELNTTAVRRVYQKLMNDSLRDFGEVLSHHA